MEILNCRGLTCPLPVTETRDYIENHPQLDRFQVLVDNPASAENVKRFLESRGFGVSVETAGSNFQLNAERTGRTGLRNRCPGIDSERSKNDHRDFQDKLGLGDDYLGGQLMLNFLKTLKEMGDELWRLVFLNSGVKLTIEGAESLPPVQELAGAGRLGFGLRHLPESFRLVGTEKGG